MGPGGAAGVAGAAGLKGDNATIAVTYRQILCSTAAACRGRCEPNEQIVGLACSARAPSQTKIVDDPERAGSKAAECSPGDQVDSFSLICLRVR